MTDDLEEIYTTRHRDLLTPLAARIQELVGGYLRTAKRIDRVSARAKAVDRFVAKAQKQKPDGTPKYNDPLNQIQDQIGARIVTFYLKDVETVSSDMMKYFRPVESKLITPDSEKEFGYFGKHYILLIPTDAYAEGIRRDGDPTFFELQVKTLFQHAWSEAEHDLGYKPDAPLTPEQRRQIAFTSAQAWGADWMFNAVYSELHS